MVKVKDLTTSEASLNKMVASYLVLEDGTVFKGYSFGYESDSEGEIGLNILMF